MTDLERLKAELERQDRELAACFDELRALDSQLSIAVSPELMRALFPDPEPTAVATVPWACRA
jgi:hypothetical protein